jgi:hypothetical protein
MYCWCKDLPTVISRSPFREELCKKGTIRRVHRWNFVKPL